MHCMQISFIYLPCFYCPLCYLTQEYQIIGQKINDTNFDTIYMPCLVLPICLVLFICLVLSISLVLWLTSPHLLQM